MQPLNINLKKALVALATGPTAAFVPNSMLIAPVRGPSTALHKSAYVGHSSFDHSSFRELLEREGLVVMKSQDVPSHFHVEERNVEFPLHWFPDDTKFIFSSEDESVALEHRFRSELIDVGAFHHVETAFYQVDSGLFGGTMRLQPSTTEVGAYLIHQFIIAFALWDDLIEEAEDFGAIDRLVQLVKATKDDNPTLAQNLANEDSTSFMKYWLLHLNSVASFCGGTDNARYDRYIDTFLGWCDALTKEMEQLCEFAS